MTHLATQRILDVEPKMVLEIAYGVEDPTQIAERYGFTENEWLLLKEHKPFVAQVEDKKAELKAGGYSFRMKSAIMAEELLGVLYNKATEEDASFHTILETVKLTSKAAGFESPQKTETPTGASFSITINLGGGKSIQLGTTAARSNENVIDIEPESYDLELGEIPEYILNAARSQALEIE